jgi:hypothetical protein
MKYAKLTVGTTRHQMRAARLNVKRYSLVGARSRAFESV